MGFVIDSPAMAQRMSAVLDKQIMARAYEVKLSPEGTLRWVERTDAGVETWHDSEPGATLWQRATVELMSLLPIEWLL
jgi:putative cardiolipin synthase